MAIVKQPTLFVTHGGGPMPLLGDVKHSGLIRFFKNTISLLPSKPSAIVCVTAHWEQPVITVSTNPAPPMLYDYGGFPPEAYTVQYPAPGEPKLARKITDLLMAAGIPCQEDSTRGFDHGTFVPLKLMFPDAEVPVVQLSLASSMDPDLHIQYGKALAPLRDENILIMGSGSSFHNMKHFMTLMAEQQIPTSWSEDAVAFDKYLQDACSTSDAEVRAQKLKHWSQAPGAQWAHPREEHLIPLHVIAGAAGDDIGKAVLNDDGLGVPVTCFLFGGSPP